jgi:outer membrane protein TolC
LAKLASTTPDTAPEHRAAVRQAGEAVRAQEGLNAASRAQRIPSVALTSQFSRIGYPSAGLPAWDDFVTDWRVAIGVQVPIFTGGRIKGDRVQAEAGLTEAKLRRQQTAKAAQLDARNALAQLDGAVANWRASEGTAVQANRAYQIADIRFREGVSTQTELLDARIALQQAEVNRAQAARDLQVARVRVALLADLPLTGSALAPAATTATPSPPRQAAQVTTGGQTLP